MQLLAFNKDECFAVLKLMDRGSLADCLYDESDEQVPELAWERDGRRVASGITEGV